MEEEEEVVERVGSSPAVEEVRHLEAGIGVKWALVGVAGRSQSPLGMAGTGSPLALEVAHHGAPF